MYDHSDKGYKKVPCREKQREKGGMIAGLELQ